MIKPRPTHARSTSLLTLIALLGATAIGAGALGGHALQGILDTGQIATWDTATRYLVWHVLAALALVLSGKPALVVPSGWLLTGALLFSGSLYAWLLLGWRPLVFITPVGGITMITGWLWLAWTFWKSND